MSGKKLILSESQYKILGLVENMSGFVCPNCKGITNFKATTGGGKKLCEELGIPFLGSVPLDPELVKHVIWVNAFR